MIQLLAGSHQRELHRSLHPRPRPGWISGVGAAPCRAAGRSALPDRFAWRRSRRPPAGMFPRKIRFRRTSSSAVCDQSISRREPPSCTASRDTSRLRAEVSPRCDRSRGSVRASQSGADAPASPSSRQTATGSGSGPTSSAVCAEDRPGVHGHRHLVNGHADARAPFVESPPHSAHPPVVRQ